MRDERMRPGSSVEAGSDVRNVQPKNLQTLLIRMLALLLVTMIFGGGGSAYSVLTHEEIVDLLWADQIRPLILKRIRDSL